jgi:hypothetical protein
MLAQVIRFYGGMPEDWLSAPYLHFIAVWRQMGEVSKRELQILWNGMAWAYHNPARLGDIWKGGAPEENRRKEPVPEDEEERRRFFDAEAKRLFRIINGGR